MLGILKSFREEESGAVTADWVVLTALVVGLSIGVLAVITEASNQGKRNIASAISTVTID